MPPSGAIGSSWAVRNSPVSRGADHVFPSVELDPMIGAQATARTTKGYDVGVGLPLDRGLPTVMVYSLVSLVATRDVDRERGFCLPLHERIVTWFRRVKV